MKKSTRQSKANKTKTKAVLLAIFFGPLAWLYTYKQNRSDFWVGTLLSIGTFGLAFPVVYLITLFERIRKPHSFYEEAGRSFSNRKLILLWSAAAVFVVFCVSLVTINVIAVNNHQREIAEKAAAEKARLSADPITTQQLYTALNKERPSAGASALASLDNLTSAAEHQCRAMIEDNFLGYKNPKSGKKANSYIEDYRGDLYFKTYVASIFTGNNTQTATDALNQALKYQATNLNNPDFNSIGWAVCGDGSGQKDIVAMLADSEQKPTAPQVINHYYPAYTPSYNRSINCTSYTDVLDETHTSCY